MEKKKSHGQRRKVGEKQFSILQVHAQIINPGELNNQKKQVYILHIILIPKQKKKVSANPPKNITHQQLGEIHLGNIFINDSKRMLSFFFRSPTGVKCGVQGELQCSLQSNSTLSLLRQPRICTISTETRQSLVQVLLSIAITCSEKLCQEHRT